MKHRLLSIATLAMMVFTACNGQKKPTIAKQQATETTDQAGGATAEELAKKVIAAFRDNNFDAYRACITNEKAEVTRKKWDFLRKYLENHGITDWSKFQFSRTTNYGANADGTLAGYEIEFDYGSFWGALVSNGAKKVNGRYFLAHSYTDAGVRRK